MRFGKGVGLQNLDFVIGEPRWVTSAYYRVESGRAPTKSGLLIVTLYIGPDQGAGQLNAKDSGSLKVAGPWPGGSPEATGWASFW